MNWKTRQMFSDREHGIVSGLSPINMTSGGNVPYPSYQNGTSPEEAETLDAMQAATMVGAPAPKDIPFEEGRTLFEYERDMYHPIAQRQMEEYALEEEEISIEQQVAELAAKMGISVPEARAMLLRQMIQAKGLTLSDEVINQFATGLITLQDALAQAIDFKAPWDQETEAPFEAIDFKAPWDQAVGTEAGGPPKMQAGTGLGEAMKIDLFQQGDEEINEPLNRLAQVTNPSIADITPTETVEETADPGPTDTSAIKRAYQELAMQAVGEAKDAIAQGAPVEQIQQPLKERLLMIDEEYRRKSGTEDTIFTEEFLVQIGPLMGETTGPVTMQDGGTVPDLLPMNELETARYEFSEAVGVLATHKAKRRPSGTQGIGYDNRMKQLEAAVQTLKEKIRLLQGEAKLDIGTSTDSIVKVPPVPKKKLEEFKKLQEDLPVKLPEEDELSTRSFWEEMKKTAMKARSGALLGGKTKQSGLSGLLDVLGQADVAEAESVGKAEQAMLRELGAEERIAAQLGKPVSLTKEERDHARGNPLYAQQIFLKRLGNNVDIDEVVEEFVREGIPLPSFNGVVVGGLGGIVTTKAGKKVDFTQFYRDSKAGNPSLKFEAIKAAWEKVKADPENTYTA